jgi:hypothetical protein
MAVWEQLVAQTKRRSRDHAALAEIYANQIVQRTNQINDDLQRVYRRVSWPVMNNGVGARLALSVAFSVAKSGTRSTKKSSRYSTNYTPP